MTILSHEQRQEFGSRVKVGSYYQDGRDLFEVTMIGSTGCVTVQDCRTFRSRCLAIDTFRKGYWLVREARP
jgi:hypothetical protein